jgi:hypothetical protein
MQDNPIKNLKSICEKLGEKEDQINKNFWTVNMHGDELTEDFIIPEGIRIIMFCYSGRELNICPRFDKFNWREIFLNEDASYNYCTFISNISQYSSLRDHFCVYNSGHTIKDILLTPDRSFRSGVYKLPVQAAVKDQESDTVYISSPELFSKVIHRETKNVRVDRANTAKIIKDKNIPNTLIFSQQYNFQKITLSKLVQKLGKNYTLLLLTCRTGKKQKIEPAPTVVEELQQLYKKYSI